MKKIFYLTFYFEPDLCAGSFRNTSLAYELSKIAHEKNCIIEVFTTFPNRYNSYLVDSLKYEVKGNLIINRVKLPSHSSGMYDQIKAFVKYYIEVQRLISNKDADLVFASSSRLFTAYLGYKIAKKKKIKLYLDIRDIFVDTIDDIIKSKIIKLILLPFLKNLEKKTFDYSSHINLISGGFRNYFNKFKCTSFTEFTNGIDKEFIEIYKDSDSFEYSVSLKTILYAGNIGEGQGLHKILPKVAKALENKFKFIVIGDGGAKSKLKEEIIKHKIVNIELRNPIKRNELILEYKKANFLFLHLNNYDAFLKVLPSKIFELATFRKPIIAGVSGYAKEFMIKEIPNCIVFKPCDSNDFIEKIKKYNNYEIINRDHFVNSFRRDTINVEMSKSILSKI